MVGGLQYNERKGKRNKEKYYGVFKETVEMTF